MTALSLDGSDADSGLLLDVNGLAGHLPHAVGRAVALTGQYGLVALAALLTVLCWWRTARRAAPGQAPAAVGGVLWAAVSAALALALDVPLRGFVRRPRPAVDHEGLHVLLGGHGYSFVSGHAAVTAALAVGLLAVSRRWGLAAVAVALAEGFCRVLMGVQYPSDVVGGYALGTAVALLLAPAGLAVLTRLAAALARTRWRGLVVRHAGSPYGEPRAEGDAEQDDGPGGSALPGTAAPRDTGLAA
jgi:undecaprenyl-diphosphatase